MGNLSIFFNVAVTLALRKKETFFSFLEASSMDLEFIV